MHGCGPVKVVAGVHRDIRVLLRTGYGGDGVRDDHLALVAVCYEHVEHGTAAEGVQVREGRVGKGELGVPEAGHFFVIPRVGVSGRSFFKNKIKK